MLKAQQAALKYLGGKCTFKRYVLTFLLVVL